MITKSYKSDLCLWSITIATGFILSLFFSCVSKEKPAETIDQPIEKTETVRKKEMLFSIKKKKSPVPVLSEKKIEENVKVYPLKIVHPGDPEERPFGLELKQYFDGEGNPSHYTLWVDSVICRDKTCEVVQVNLKWDALGNFDSYEVEKGEDLTKLDHVPFSKEDHAKLHRILSDRESPLREVTKEGLVGDKSKKKAAVDGVAGATVLTLSSTVVLGAGYTCYDLWHWANGEVSKIIRNKSSKAVKLEKLQDYLRSDSADKVDFALTCLKERKVRDAVTVDTVIKCLEKGSDELIKPALEFLSAAAKDKEEYFQNLIKVFNIASSEKRVFIITSLTKSTVLPSQDILDKLAAYLPELESYHEVHLMLTLFENNNKWSQTIETNSAALLDHKKFFFSRRAYWFLNKQKLSPEVKKKVDVYFQKNELRLL